MFSYSTYDKTKITIEGYNGDESDKILIPSKIGNFFVKKIGTSAFEDDINFTNRVEIGHGIDIIGKEAFKGCEAVVIVLPSSITTIESRAFAECENLREVIFLGDEPKSSAVADDIFDESDLVSVFYYETTRGWKGATFKNRPLKAMNEDIQSLGEESDDQSSGEMVNDISEGEEMAAKESRYYQEDNPEGPESLWEEPKEIEYKAEMKAFERTGFVYVKSTSLKNVTNPYEAFKLRLTNAFDKFSRELRISGQLQHLLDPILSIQHIEFKNPFAYMLGYAVIENKRINKPRLENAIKLLPEIVPKGEITEVDILRYAYYWIEILLPSV